MSEQIARCCADVNPVSRIKHDQISTQKCTKGVGSAPLYDRYFNGLFLFQLRSLGLLNLPYISGSAQAEDIRLHFYTNVFTLLWITLN